MPILKIEKLTKKYGKTYALNGLDMEVKKGDIVTIIMPNTPEAVISIYALNRIGAVANIIHPLSAQKEIKSYLNSAGSEIALCVDLCYQKISNIINDTNLKKVVFVSAGDSMPVVMKTLYSIKTAKNPKPNKSNSRYILWKDFVKCSKAVAEYLPVGEENDKAAIILHSGGTTGIPKDIQLTNHNFNCFGIQSVFTLRDVSVGDKILAILPIFHGFGLGVCVHVAFCFGACSVLIPQFNAKKFVGTLKKYKPTMLFGVPTLYEALIKANGADKLDLSFLKYVVSGGDSLPKPLENSVNEFLATHDRGFSGFKFVSWFCL